MIRETFPVGPLQCNCSILGDEASHEAIVVDPGDEIPRLLALLAKHQLTVKQIVVTHAHIDHIAGALELKRITGAPVLYNQRDLPLVAMMAEQAGWLGVPVPKVAPPDDTLEDGRTIAIGTSPQPEDETSVPHSSQPSAMSGPPPTPTGLTGTILHTPGHTQGSVCLYLPAEHLLLAGDTLFAGSIGRTDLPGGDTRTILRSIHAKLLPLPDDTLVIPGHGPTTTIAAERESNPFLQ
jgi:glyoxylase-like metal-dependent hydrolase (beta-lactamase superfamily II)